MNAVSVNHVAKSYGGRLVVDDLSFSVAQGEIFGLIGPNGAGKTTSIRMMMDIIKPDAGDVTILGERSSDATKSKLGYLPEERGLYKKLRVMDSIIYLASLKGMEPHAARIEAERLLDQTGMLPAQSKKIDELSKGMGQIIQFIVTIVHNPDLIILDEPFGGLDPVNTELLKSMIMDLRQRGKAVILSTHQMNQVEELCDRILMIDHGSAVLYGDLRDIKSKFGGNSVIVDFEGQLGTIPGVVERRTDKHTTELVLDGNTSAQQVLGRLVSSGVMINRFEVATPSLNEIFLQVAGKRHG